MKIDAAPSAKLKAIYTNEWVYSPFNQAFGLMLVRNIE